MSRRTDTLPKGRVDHGTISVSIRTIGVGGCWCQSREANKFEKVVEKLYFNVTEAISKERGGKWALRRGRAGCHLHSNESSALCVLKRWRKVWLKLGAPGQSSVGHQCWLERVGIDGSLFGESVSGWRGSVLFNPTQGWDEALRSRKLRMVRGPVCCLVIVDLDSGSYRWPWGRRLWACAGTTFEDFLKRNRRSETGLEYKGHQGPNQVFESSR